MSLRFIHDISYMTFHTSRSCVGSLCLILTTCSLMPYINYMQTLFTTCVIHHISYMTFHTSRSCVGSFGHLSPAAETRVGEERWGGGQGAACDGRVESDAEAIARKEEEACIRHFLKVHGQTAASWSDVRDVWRQVRILKSTLQCAFT